MRASLNVVPLTVSIRERGLQVAQRYGLSTYNAMIVAAALESQCQALWSEDMHHELRIDGLTIRNPFASA